MSRELRSKLISQMNFYGFSPHTQRNYVGAVKELAKHYNKSPDTLTDEQVRAYVCYLLE